MTLAVFLTILLSHFTPSGQTATACRTTADGVGPAVMLDTAFTLMAPQRYQSMCELASGESLYLVAWQDMRTGEDASGEYNWDVRVARVTPAGVLLDTLGIPITDLPGLETYAAAAWDGTNWIVVWSDTRSGNLGEDLYGCRITPAGTPLDTNGFLISGAAGRQMLPSVEFDGTNYLVAWRDDQGNDFRIRCARVTPDGTVLDPSGIEVTPGPNSFAPAVAARAGEWLIAWEDGANFEYIRAARVAEDGTVRDPGGFVVSTARFDRYLPDAGFDGTNWLVAWTDRRRGSNPRYFAIYAARIDTAANVIDTAGIEVYANDGYFSGYPDVSWGDSVYLIVWGNEIPMQGSTGMAGRLTASGQVVDPSGIPLANMGYMVGDVVWDGNNWLAASPGLYEGSEPGEGEDVRAVRISPAGQVLDPNHIWLSWSADWQYSPKAAVAGQGWLAIWQNKVGPDDFDLHARLLDGSGQPQGQTFAVSTATRVQGPPDVAAGPGDTIALVVWEDRRAYNADIYAARVTAGGSVLDPAGIVVASSGDEYRSPAVAFDGTNWLVTWWGWRTYEYSIYGARVSPQGTVLEPEGRRLVDPTMITGGPSAVASLAYDGNNYLLVWSDARAGNGDYDLYGARVTRANTVLDPNGFKVAGSTPAWEIRPAVAWSGGRYFVFWQANDVYSPREVRFTMVDTSGASLDSSGWLVCTAGGVQHSCRADFDGTNVVAAWTDSRGRNLYYARVGTEGTVLDPQGMPVAQEPGRQSSVDVAARANGRVLLVWSGYFEERYASDRVVAALYDRQSVMLQAPTPSASSPFTGPTVVRGTLHLPKTISSSPGCLLDISGRRVMILQAGVNDVSRLAPGVYFVRPASGAERSASGVERMTRVVVVE